MVSPGLLLIGDSQLKYAQQYAELFPGFEVTVISQSGMRLEEVDEPKLMATEFFNDVVIHLGTNNLICGQSLEQVILHYEALIKQILKRNPQVRLFVSSILFRSTNRFKPYSRAEVMKIEKINADTRKLNSHLEEMAPRYGIYYIENWEAFSQTSSDPYSRLLSRDGLHLSPQGVQCLIGNVISFCFETRQSCLNIRQPFRSSNSGTHSVDTHLSNLSASCCLVRNSSLLYSDAVRVSSRLLTVNGATDVSVSSASNSQPGGTSPVPVICQSSINNQTVPVVKTSRLLSACHAASDLPVNNGKSKEWILVTYSKRRVSGKVGLSLPSQSSSVPLYNRWEVLNMSCDLLDVSTPSKELFNIKTSSVECRVTHLSSKKKLKQSSECSVSSYNIHDTQAKSHKYSGVVSSEFVVNCGTSMKSLSVSRSAPLLNCRHVQCSDNLLTVPPSYSSTKSSFDFSEVIFCSCQVNRNGGAAEKESVSKKSSIYPRKCENCSKVYSSKSSFSGHKKICGKPRNKTNLYPRVCTDCNIQYCDRTSFSRHKKSCNVSSSLFSCTHPECTVKFRTYSVMVKHLQTQHCQNIDEEEHVFKDMSEFLVWKESHTQENHISMVQLSVRKQKGYNLYYYVCKFKKLRKNSIPIRKTSRKWKRGPMPDTNCLARMSVKETDTGVCVKYLNAHNHDLSFSNVKYFRLDSSTKSHITHLLEQGVPTRTVQEYFQPADIDVVTPIKEHFLTLTQLSKMKYALRMKKRLSKDDAEAVNILVHSLKEKCENPVLIYKPQGMPTEIGDKNLDKLPRSSELFVLGIQGKKQETEMISGCARVLCIDSTHGTNQYKFHLINLVVPDEYGVGYPVAHFITNFLDESTLVFLLESIQKRIPNLKINAVVTDGDEALAKAIVSVFGVNVRHLLCTWHVKRNWYKNLLRKLKGNESLISEIHKALLILIDEKNEEKFNIMLDEFCSKYFQCAPSFIEYFQENYLRIKEKWAMCYRNFAHAATETNMFVETFHNKLKTQYLERKVNRRLDDLITILLQINKTIHLGLKYKRLTQMPPLGFNESIELRHIKSQKMSDINVIETEDNSVWYVISQSDSLVMYKVIRINSKCIHPESCFIKCSQYSCFGLCSHMYSCSCPDAHGLCKHIHKVYSHIIRNGIPTCVVSESEKPVEVTCKSQLSHNEKNDELVRSICHLADKLKMFASHRKNSPLLPHIYKSLKLLTQKCDGLAESENNLSKPPYMVHDTLPPNIKIVPQQRLFQTIKKRKSVKHHVKKPDQWKKNEIEKSLLFRKENSFTEPIKSKEGMCTTIYRVGAHSVNSLHLKSLDSNIPRTEFEILSSLDPQFKVGWLYDTIISAFLHKISFRDPSVTVIDPTVSQLVVGEREIDVVLTCLKSVNWFSCIKIIIPLNPHNSHWLLLVADTVSKQVSFYDPLSMSLTEMYKSSVCRWVQVLSSKLGMTVSEWKIKVPKHCLQKDSSSCGVFVCWYAEKILLGDTTDNTFHVNDYRRYIYNIITGREHDV